jgi:lycopene cyclase CruA
MTVSSEKMPGAKTPLVDACAPCIATATLPEANDPVSLADRLRPLYPRTVTALEGMEGGLNHLNYIVALEERWKKIAKGQLPTEHEVLRYVPQSALSTPDAEYDLVYCGGVLGLFSAAVMAQKGYKVAVLDQRRVGTSHREWNISDDELQNFTRAGLFSRAEYESAIAGRYNDAIVRFLADGIPEEPAALKLDRVLDVAMDLGKLLDMARQKFELAGGVCYDYHALNMVYLTESGKVRGVVEAQDANGKSVKLGARLVVNALGSISPLSLVLGGGKPFDGVCPTVGSTARGFAAGKGDLEVHPEVGDVLISVAHAQLGGRQLIWEGFPTQHGDMTTYVFYYDLVKPELADKQSLLELFEAYFELLPTYKNLTPDFEQLKPVYGYIPARHHRPLASASRRGIISVGDATSPQSALTFCGFGSQVRNLPRLTRLLAFALDHDLLEEKHLRQIGAHQSNISPVWFFSRFMQPLNPHKRPNDVNRLMNVFCAVLNTLGASLTRRFFQDKFGWWDFTRLLLTTARRSPRVFPLAWGALGPRGIVHGMSDYARFGREALLRSVYKRFRRPFSALEKRFTRKRPALALKLAARREEWEAAELL